MSEQHVTVRFYAAAAEAAGTKEISLALAADPVRLDDFLEMLPKNVPQADDDTAPSLAGVCGYSSFLVNAVQAKPHKSLVAPGDTVDILPPFAGG
ncbi:MAG: MoaD/ThiS family protein [Nesterenkonia sp.]